MNMAAGMRPQLNHAPAPAHRNAVDLRRIAEDDRDYTRLHARTARLLTASLRQLVRDLRGSASHDETPILSAFIARHTAILRDAYTQAHGEGVRDYYDGVSLTPARWATAAAIAPEDHQIARRLAFYAPSVAKMAHEALVAWHAEQAGQRVAAAPKALSEPHTGVMVALMLAPDVARQLAIPGGEPVSELHITLAYLGDASDLTAEQLRTLRQAVASFAEDADVPLRPGRVTGVARFAGKPDRDTEPVYAAVRIPGLQAWRAALVKRLVAADLPVDETFRTYTPHITLAYVRKGQPSPVRAVPHVGLAFTSLSLVVGSQRQDWRIGDEQEGQSRAMREAEAVAARASRVPYPRTIGASDADAWRLATPSDPASGDEQLPLDDWLGGLGQRITLQATVTWPGLQDGYVDGGSSDSANPFAVISWVLEPMAKHCDTCPIYAAGSPYDPPWVQGGNQLDATPGDGHTECGAACKCSLEYGTAPEADFRPVWGDPSNAPPAPPVADGGTGEWPTVTPPPSAQDLETQQMRAMDDYRVANDRWEAIRGSLPALPDMFAPDSHGANWPAWEAMSPVQRAALKAVFDALTAFERATPGGALPLEQAIGENAQAQEELAALQSQLEHLADHYDQFVDELNQAADQDTRELFGKGLLGTLWFQLQHDLDAAIEFLWHLPPKGLGEPSAIDGVRLSGHEPGYNAQGHGAHGHWLPGQGGEAESGGGGVPKGGGRTPRAGAGTGGGRGRRNTPEQQKAAHDREEQLRRARRARAQQERVAKMTPEERAKSRNRTEGQLLRGTHTPEELRARQRESNRASRQRAREVQRQRTRTPEELAVPVPHLAYGTPGAKEALVEYRAKLRAARAMAKARIAAERTRLIPQHAATRARILTLRAQYEAERAKYPHVLPWERESIHERLTAIVKQHNELQQWIRDHPIPPAELSEPPLDDILLADLADDILLDDLDDDGKQDFSRDELLPLDAGNARLYTASSDDESEQGEQQP